MGVGSQIKLLQCHLHDETRQRRLRRKRVHRWWMGCGIELLAWTRLLDTAAHEWWLLLARTCLAKLVGWKHEAVAQQRRR